MKRIDRRAVLKSVTATTLLSSPWTRAAVNWTGKARVLQGPMLGPATATTASVWLRGTAGSALGVRATSPAGEVVTSTEVTVVEDSDFCAVARLDGLEPDTAYTYEVLVDGQPDPYLLDFAPYSLRTAPAESARFKVAFGSCAKFQDDPIQPIWTAVEASRPDLFFWLGDNIYADTLHDHVMSEDYRRQRSVVSLQNVIRNVPSLAIWDDHDFGLNDHDARNPGKDMSLEIFKRYWANPSYGLGEAPGVFFQYSFGGVDFFFLDVRYYRSPNEEPDSNSKTMLGRAQMDWLEDALRRSQAPFKVLISGSGWTKAKGPIGDAWSAYLTERDRLFRFITRNEIPGVLLISGDTHVGEANCIPWSEQGGYDFYDFVSSPLAQKPEGGSWLERRPEVRLRQVYYRTNNFGELSFDMTLDDPAVTFRLRDTRNQSVWRPITLTASQLTPGQSSWREQIDRVSLQRQESMSSGGPYYIPL